MSAASALMLESSPIHGWPATRGDKSEAPATRNVPTPVVSIVRAHGPNGTPTVREGSTSEVFPQTLPNLTRSAQHQTEPRPKGAVKRSA